MAYLGTPELAVPPLRALVAAGIDVPLVVTRPDRRRGRGSVTTPSPVKAAATDLGLAVSHEVDDVLRSEAQLGVVVAFGRLIPSRVLEKVPMVNLHFSLLPRWRGAAPLERAILAGDERTGVDLMAVDEELDTGGIYRRVELPIGPDDTLAELRERLAKIGADILVDALQQGLGEPRPQEGEVTYAAKLDAAELRIDWSRPAREVHRLVRLGGAWTTHDGKRLKILATRVPAAGDGPQAEAGDAPVELLEVQPEGRRRMSARAWANGAGWRPGDPLGA